METTSQVKRSSSIMSESSIPPPVDILHREISVEERVKKRKVIPTCFDFNLDTGCFLSSCDCAHRCAVCGSSSHGWSSCKRRIICLAFSKGNCLCGAECDSRHCCIICHGPHQIGDLQCSLFSTRSRENDISLKYCLKWNATGHCEVRGTDHRHNCCFCRSPSHGSYACFHALETLINPQVSLLFFLISSLIK
jgi:hypothetical protein